MSKKLIWLPILMGFLTFAAADACTTISYKDLSGQTWVLKSFDYHNHQGHIFLNKRGARKIAMTSNLQKSKVWVSKYASLTFNQVGRDLSYGGMNEAGLSMEIMWLDAAKFPAPDDRPRINEAQIIQYVLDSAATTVDAIEKMESVSVEKAFAPVHYMICDRKDDCRTVEYLNNALVVTPMNNGIERILQNTVYAQDLQNIRSGKGTVRVPYAGLLDIFDLDAKSSDAELVNFSFENLERVAQKGSVWQIVYNLNEGTVFFKNRGASDFHYADFADVELNCTKESTALVFDITNLTAGKKADWIEFSDNVADKMLATLTEFPPQMIEDFRKFSKISNSCAL